AARENAQIMAEQIEAAYVSFARAIAQQHPTIQILEDVHWGDAASLKLLDTALRELRDQPFVVLAFARPEVHQRFPRLWAGRNMQEIRLSPLSRRATEDLARAVLEDDAARAQIGMIVERAGGNAFYLEELIRATAEGRGDELPETVLGMVE